MTAYGYARVSTADQDPQLQLDALRGAGCDQVVAETGSGALTDRPALRQVLAQLQPGDSLTVWAIDRLGRSARDLLNIIHEIQETKAAFRSLREGLDTSTEVGRLMITVLAGVAQMERERTVARIHAGIAAARQRPAYRHGRPPKLTPAQLDEVLHQRSAGTPKRTIAARLRVARTTLDRALAAHDARHAAKGENKSGERG
jgi:DNA invertase Pin-like site-specific DNA recombinase